MPLADLVDGAWVRGEAARLADSRLLALESLMEARLRCGGGADLAGELEELAAAHPLRERFWAQRMLALYRADRQAEALHVYQQARRMLAEEHGIEPGSELRELQRQILA